MVIRYRVLSASLSIAVSCLTPTEVTFRYSTIELWCVFWCYYTVPCYILYRAMLYRSAPRNPPARLCSLRVILMLEDMGPNGDPHEKVTNGALVIREELHTNNNDKNITYMHRFLQRKRTQYHALWKSVFIHIILCVHWLVGRVGFVIAVESEV